MKKLNYPQLRQLDFAVWQDKYVTLRSMEHEKIKIPAGFVFDGVTVKAPFTFIFSNKDLRQGIKASCFHDFMCQHKDIYTRTEATTVLIKLWKKDGLDSFKVWIVKVAVNVYQWFKGWR